MKSLGVVAFLTVSFLFPLLGEEVIIHEWGTFTSLQNERGEAIAGVNSDDEPVPDFVHTLSGGFVFPSTGLTHEGSKGLEACHTDVTMRLETPVLYVHAPESFTGPLKVHVAFNGGWLTEFYPKATVKAPGFHSISNARISKETVGELTWPSVKVEPSDSKLMGPETKDEVWLAPGRVKARMLTVDKENERFLFYRGVGHLDAPLKVVRSGEGKLTVDWQTPPTQGEVIRDLWLLDVRPDGSAAYRMLSPKEGEGTVFPADIAATFSAEEYSKEKVGPLREQLKKGLVADGLYEDEAEALLNTWESSYFKNSGLRLFFLVPRAWTDRYLPLTASLPDGKPVTQVARSMVGRIEIVSPEQRELLKVIAKGPVPSSEERDAFRGKPELYGEIARAKRSIRDAGIPLSPVYSAYVDLGRFRETLVLDELKRAPTPALAEFVKALRIRNQR